MRHKNLYNAIKRKKFNPFDENKRETNSTNLTNHPRRKIENPSPKAFLTNLRIKGKIAIPLNYI